MYPIIDYVYNQLMLQTLDGGSQCVMCLKVLPTRKPPNVRRHYNKHHNIYFRNCAPPPESEGDKADQSEQPPAKKKKKCNPLPKRPKSARLSQQQAVAVTGKDEKQVEAVQHVAESTKVEEPVAEPANHEKPVMELFSALQTTFSLLRAETQRKVVKVLINTVIDAYYADQGSKVEELRTEGTVGQ